MPPQPSAGIVRVRLGVLVGGLLAPSLALLARLSGRDGATVVSAVRALEALVVAVEAVAVIKLRNEGQG